jgi:hypothetical protein
MHQQTNLPDDFRRDDYLAAIALAWAGFLAYLAIKAVL